MAFLVKLICVHRLNGASEIVVKARLEGENASSKVKFAVFATTHV